jgi:hypothetical protein
MDPSESQNHRQPENRTAFWVEVIVIGVVVHLTEIGIDRLVAYLGFLPPAG